MALSFEERDKFLESVGYNYKDEPCNIDFSVRGGYDLREVFKVMKEYQKAGFADEYSSITFNGLTLVAGIYDNANEYMETFNGIHNNDRDAITKNFKSTNNVGALIESFNHINDYLKKYGFEPFSEEEEVEIISHLKLNIKNSK